MKILTSELIGPALDWAAEAANDVASGERRVIKACRVEATTPAWIEVECFPGSAPDYFRSSASTNWAQGGPIIEREKIVFDFYPDGAHPNGGEWLANTPAYQTDAGVPLHEEFGPTLLIAAMRCYVASKLGDEIDIPEEFLS